MNLDDASFLRSLGALVRERRVGQGLTQAELGRRAGLDRTFVGSVERGERNLSILNLRLLAKALRTPIKQLLP